MQKKRTASLPKPVSWHVLAGTGLGSLTQCQGELQPQYARVCLACASIETHRPELAPPAAISREDKALTVNWLGREERQELQDLGHVVIALQDRALFSCSKLIERIGM